MTAFDQVHHTQPHFEGGVSCSFSGFRCVLHLVPDCPQELVLRRPRVNVSEVRIVPFCFKEPVSYVGGLQLPVIPYLILDELLDLDAKMRWHLCILCSKVCRCGGFTEM